MKDCVEIKQDERSWFGYITRWKDSSRILSDPDLNPHLSDISKTFPCTTVHTRETLLQEETGRHPSTINIVPNYTVLKCEFKDQPPEKHKFSIKRRLAEKHELLPITQLPHQGLDWLQECVCGGRVSIGKNENTSGQLRCYQTIKSKCEVARGSNSKKLKENVIYSCCKCTVHLKLLGEFNPKQCRAEHRQVGRQAGA